MEYRKHQDTYIVRIDRGEEVTACLKKLCVEQGISLAQVSAIGAADRAEIGLYNVEKQQYIKTDLEGEMEVISMLGNVTVKDGEVYLHLHASFGLSDITCEMFVRELPGRVGRAHDDVTGLNLFSFGEA